MLDLSDPRWAEYRTRSGNGADLVPLLQKTSADDADYYRIFHECCDLHTFELFAAAYAVMPHLARRAADAVDARDMIWPQFIAAAFCSNYKVADAKDDIPADLLGDFRKSAKLAYDTSIRLVETLSDKNPSFQYATMLTSIYNIDSKPLFGNPLPGTFILINWFEERKPSQL